MRTTRIQAIIPVRAQERLDDLAKRDGRTLSNLIGKILEDWLAVQPQEVARDE